jgi:hypothetical protein
MLRNVLNILDLYIYPPFLAQVEYAHPIKRTEFFFTLRISLKQSTIYKFC